MSKLKTVFLWVLQIALFYIMFQAALAKFQNVPMVVEIFTVLGLEPTGRYIIATLEMIGAFFLLIPRLITTGAFLIFAVMLGAGIAHTTVLGMEGTSMFVIAIVLSAVILSLRRKRLPIFGKTM